MIREFRSKWKSASFFGLGLRPVAMEGCSISGRAHLFWAAQLNAVEHPAVAVNQVVYCKKTDNGGGVNRKGARWKVTDTGGGRVRNRKSERFQFPPVRNTWPRSCSWLLFWTPIRSQNSSPLSSPAGMLSDSSSLWYGHRASTKILPRLSPTPNSSMPRFIWTDYDI